MNVAELLRRLKNVYAWIPSNIAAKKKMAELIESLGGKV